MTIRNLGIAREAVVAAIADDAAVGVTTSWGVAKSGPADICEKGRLS